MNFSILSDCHKKWQDILVIGKTIERDGRKYHLVGMTLSDEAKLYIIEPYDKQEPAHLKGIRNHRQILKEHKKESCCYLHCSSFYLGDKKLPVQGGTGGSLEYSVEDPGMIQLFLDMMSAGWTVPEWLQDTDWTDLQLVTLTIADMEKLPDYSPDMPITITHRPDSAQHILEKTVTLNVGKSRSFYFTDEHGDNVQCHINNVTLIDVWKSTEEKFRDPKLSERFTPEQLAQARKHSYDALEQCCPKGMCYVGIEYECSKDYGLVFHSRQYLKSRPETHQGSSHFLMMRLKPDQETGTHGLPLKGCVIETPFSPDTAKIPTELFLYYEKIDEWTETVSDE
ncbi:MAG: hypothetical protein K2P48_06535 [Lachnospiraceae bacterium]|nr:hypothetical protein [Lachnospiraceae bacterium]